MRTTGLVMGAPLRRALLAHARRDDPHECCGLLLGSGRQVRAVLAMRNAAGARSRTRYRLDPADHLAVQRLLRGLSPRLAVVGVYHSHPRGPAVPSPTDVAEAWYPDWLHVIIGLVPRARIAAFRIRHGRVQALPIGRPRSAGRRRRHARLTP